MSLYLIPIILLCIPKICYIIWIYPLVVYIFEKRSTYVKINSKRAFRLQSIYTLVNIIFIIILKLIIQISLKNPYPLYILMIISNISAPIIFVTTAIFVIVSLFNILKTYSYE